MRITIIKKLALAMIAVLALGSCGNYQAVDFKPLTFARYQPIYLNVSNVEFIQEYKSPLKSPYVEHLMPYSPEEAMHIWVKDRIRAIGPDKVLQVIIKDASVKAFEVHKENSFEQFFVIDQDRRYVANRDVELRVYGYISALSEASVRVKASRSMTLSENASLSHRNAALRGLIGSLMSGVNAELEKSIFMYMGDHINYSQNP